MNVQQFNAWAQQMQNAVNAAHSTARRALAGLGEAAAETQQLLQRNQQLAEEIARMQTILQGIRVNGKSGPEGPHPYQVGREDMLTIEQIPGRRIPYDLTVQIGVPDNTTDPLTGSHPLSMDGPFIAVARYATFMSSYTFQVTTAQSTDRYTGRTWGRQRPISSVVDIMDGVAGWVDGLPNELTTGDCAQEGPPSPALTSRPASRAPSRSMVFDGYIEISSSVYPRQNQQVPSSLWAPGLEQMLQMPVLDYWEKGEIIEVKIQPMHVNNPAAGNIQALLGSMPYLQGQFDGHEGVMYPSWQCTPSQADIIARRPAGVLILGYLGYKILQPPGVRLR